MITICDCGNVVYNWPDVPGVLIILIHTTTPHSYIPIWFRDIVVQLSGSLSDR